MAWAAGRLLRRAKPAGSGWGWWEADACWEIAAGDWQLADESKACHLHLTGNFGHCPDLVRAGSCGVDEECKVCRHHLTEFQVNSAEHKRKVLPTLRVLLVGAEDASLQKEASAAESSLEDLHGSD